MKINKGFSLVEVLLVLGFAAVLIAGAFLAYSNVKSSNNINNEVKAAAAMSAGVQALYANSPNYDGLSSVIMINAGIVPKNKINTNGSTIIYNLGNGTEQITIRSNGELFNFRYIDAAQSKHCAKFALAVAPSFNRIAIGNRVVKSFDQKIDTANVIDACNNTNQDIQLIND